MRSTNVLLILALISISAISAFEFNSLAEVQELKASSYGNSLIETISLSLQNSGSINDVQKLLDDLLFKLNKDQEDADKEWEKTNKTLTEKIENLKAEIETLRVKIAELEKEIADYKQKIATGNENLKQYNEDVAKNTKTLADLEATRKADNEAYKKAVQEHSDVINAIQAVVAELSKLKGSVSGVAKPTHVEEIAAEKRDREYKESLKTAFVQVTRDEQEAMIFAELATSADQAALGKLIGLLNDLENSVKKSLNDDEANEQASKATYQNLHDALVADNEKLAKLIVEQTNRIKEYTEKVAKLEVTLQETQKLKDNKEHELKLTIKERQDKENQYNSDKAERASEKAVIQRLQKIVQERLNNMSKFLRSNTGAF